MQTPHARHHTERSSLNRLAASATTHCTATQTVTLVR